MELLKRIAADHASGTSTTRLVGQYGIGKGRYCG
jgi:hypothetical protein